MKKTGKNSTITLGQLRKMVSEAFNSEQDDSMEDVVNAMNDLNKTSTSTGLISREYADQIFEAIAGDVIEDLEASAGEDWNDDDLRLAVGRALVKALGIE